MSKATKKKGITYYFRIEFSSLQGKITTGFCILGLFTILLMVATAYLLRPVVDKSDYINKIIYPSHLQITTLQNNLNKTTSFFKEAHLQENKYLQETEIQQHIAQIRKPLDSLKVLSQSWQMNDEILSLQFATNKAETLIEKLQKANSTSSSEVKAILYNQDIAFLIKEIETALAKVVKSHTSLRNSYNNYIDNRTDNFVLILVLSFLVALVTGATIASFIVVSVLNVIKHLKRKILELSEGNLIEPIPHANNELNTIGKAVNVLVDNLRDIKKFAIEVGKGNFDNNISVFNNQGELGHSLAEMRESLKKVAEEERIRAWTSEGLASFSEFLRNSNNDLTEFSNALISKIVKYININQGAIYIVDGHETNPVLELKGCFAYDRQKFIEKVVEPGQGFVGQAYLEKEHIYLNNAPDKFSTITSGLGGATPKILLVLPLKINQEVNGVLELASFSEIEEYKIQFLQKLAENISSAIANVHNSQAMNNLLHDAQEMTAAMKIQEETLRQNAEELIATQEKLEKEIEEIKLEHNFTEAALSLGSAPQIIINDELRVQWLNKSAESLLNNQLFNIKNRFAVDFLSFKSSDSLETFIKKQGSDDTEKNSEVMINNKTLNALVQGFSANNKNYYIITLTEQVLL